MSEKKWLLFILETITLINISVAYALVLALRMGRTPEQLEPYVNVTFFVVFPVWFMAVILIVEFARAHRSGQSMGSRLDPSEIKLLLRWCSFGIGLISIISFLFALFYGIDLGRVTWTSSQDFTEKHALASSLGAIIFCSLAMPVFSSSRRMPGSFSDHF